MTDAAMSASDLIRISGSSFEAMKPRRIEIGAGRDVRQGGNAKAVDQTGEKLRIAS